MGPKMHRRGLLAGAAASGMGLLLVSPRTAFTYEANDRLNVALVGVHGRACVVGFVPHLHTLDNVSISALCDVDDRKLVPIFQQWQERALGWVNSPSDVERRGADVYQRMLDPGRRPPLYRDFRKMLDAQGDHIDAVVCATPDHTHAAISAASLRAGKHIYAEKPLTLRVGEARALRKLAAERPQLATSMGNQGTATKPFRRGVELLREGVLGPVEEVHVWFSRGGQNHQQAPQGAERVPPELHWDLWLGPVASRPYNSRWIARNHWRDTTIGELGNFAPHTANMAFMGLNICDLWQRSPEASATSPIRIQAEVSSINQLSFPSWERIVWQVPERPADPSGAPMPPLTIHWYHGPRPHFSPGDREKLQAMVRDFGGTAAQVETLMGDAGALIIGAKGALLTNSHNTQFHLLPAEKFKDVPQNDPQRLPLSIGHHQDWLAACRGDSAPRPLASFDYAATFLEFINLGDLATRFAPTQLEYDPVEGRILHHTEAQQRLDPGYRPGWNL